MIARGQITIWACNDGKDYEWIYKRTNAITPVPSRPDSKQEDDYVPVGWTDNFLGVDESNRVEWACQRVKRDGVWGSFSVPTVVHLWSKDGAEGKPGPGINARGNWVASAVPYKRNDMVNFAYGTFIALRDTSEPPMGIAKFKNGNYRLKRDGRYILAGNAQSMSVNSDWMIMTPPDNNATFWLDSSVGNVSFNSLGRPSPSAVQVTCRMNMHGTVRMCDLFYLAARKYDGEWKPHVSAVRYYQITLDALEGYTQFAVRAYRSVEDANAWNDNFVCEKGIGVSRDGKNDSAFLYDNGVWESGRTYVWNESRRDKVIYPFNNVYYNFLVRAKGMSVKDAPRSVNGDENWEVAQKFSNIASDTMLVDGANIAGFLFKDGIMRSQDETNGRPNLELNGKTGYLRGNNVSITGVINASSGTLGKMIINAQEADDGLYYGSPSGSSEFIMRPHYVTTIPYDVFTEMPYTSRNVNTLLSVRRANNNVLERVAYFEGLTEVNGRLGVGRRTNGAGTGYDKRMSSLVTEGILNKGQFCLAPKIVNTNTLLDWNNCYIVVSMNANNLRVTLPDATYPSMDNDWIEDGFTYFVRKTNETDFKIIGKILDSNNNLKSEILVNYGHLVILTYLKSAKYWISNII